MKFQLICLVINLVCLVITVACSIWIHRIRKAAEREFDATFADDPCPTVTFNGVTIPVEDAHFDPDGTLEDEPALGLIEQTGSRPGGTVTQIMPRNEEVP